MPRSLLPRLLSFDVFGTLINVREGSYGAFRSILMDVPGGSGVDVRAFFEYWEERNIAHYWEPYRRYRDIAELSLGEAFAHFGLSGDMRWIQRYFDVFGGFELYPDVALTLQTLSQHYRLALVSNIDDDLLAATRLGRDFDLVTVYATWRRGALQSPEQRDFVEQVKTVLGQPPGSSMASNRSNRPAALNSEGDPGTRRARRVPKPHGDSAGRQGEHRAQKKRT